MVRKKKEGGREKKERERETVKTAEGEMLSITKSSIFPLT